MGVDSVIWIWIGLKHDDESDHKGDDEHDEGDCVDGALFEQEISYDGIGGELNCLEGLQHH